MPKFEERPDGAAPLFDSNSGALAANKRWEEKRNRDRQMMIEFAKGELKVSDISYEEAYEFVIMNPQFRASMSGKTAAAKFVAEQLGERPDHVDAKMVIDNRQVNFMSLRLTPTTALAYIEDQQNDNPQLAALVEASIDFDANKDELQVVSIPVK